MMWSFLLKAHIKNISITIYFFPTSIISVFFIKTLSVIISYPINMCRIHANYYKKKWNSTWSLKSFTESLFQHSCELSWKGCAVLCSGSLLFRPQSPLGCILASMHWKVSDCHDLCSTPPKSRECTDTFKPSDYLLLVQVNTFLFINAYPKDGSFSGSCLLPTSSGCFVHPLLITGCTCKFNPHLVTYFHLKCVLTHRNCCYQRCDSKWCWVSHWAWRGYGQSSTELSLF